MTVQSFPASKPVTGRVPGAAGLVACVAGLVAVAAGLVTGLVAGGLGEDRAGELAADGEAAGVACLPGCVPPQAARPVAMAAARANRVISSVLMLPACAAHAGRQRPSVPFRTADGHVLAVLGRFRAGSLGLMALQGTPEDAIGLVTSAC
jgi:hypothetical protein